MPNEKISAAMISCDEKILTLTNLDSLEVIAPNDEENGQLKAYDGDRNLLANPEKFIDEMLKVKGFATRVKALKFLKIHDELFADLEPKVILLMFYHKNRLKK